jgi:hypothetical protein
MRKFRFLSLALAGALLFSSTAAFGQHSALRAASAKPSKVALPAPRDPSEITAAKLKEYLYYVAADERQGRDTPSEGLNQTASYIADHLKKWGVKPAGDNGTYFQKIILRRSKIDPTATRAALNDKTFAYGEDFFVASGANANVNTNGDVRGALVFVGNGWVVPSENINAYEGVDVKDKIMIVVGDSRNRPPRGVTQADLQGKAGVNWFSPPLYAETHGAKAIILIPRATDYERMERFLRSSAMSGGGYFPVAFQTNADKPSFPILIPTRKMLDAIFEGEKLSTADALKLANSGEGGAAFDLAASKQFAFSAKSAIEEATTQNVVGMVEGSDPQLKKEYVAIGAHYDHVGVAGKGSGQCAAVNGDTICNGADDDGSGTVAAMSLADAFAHELKPKRSILFVWHCGEEKGLWGSRYFTEHPTVPIHSIIAQLNIDMIGRSRQPNDTRPMTGPEEIFVIGSKMMSTSLGATSERINAEYLKLNFNYFYDAPNDPDRLFFRSDHFNYAKQGIPIIFYFDGMHADYHQPSDSPDKIDYDKMQRVARTVYMTAAALANAPQRPEVDKKLPAQLTER